MNNDDLAELATAFRDRGAYLESKAEDDHERGDARRYGELADVLDALARCERFAERRDERPTFEALEAMLADLGTVLGETSGLYAKLPDILPRIVQAVGNCVHPTTFFPLLNQIESDKQRGHLWQMSLVVFQIAATIPGQQAFDVEV